MAVTVEDRSGSEVDSTAEARDVVDEDVIA